MISIILLFFGTVFFFIPGLLISFLIFKKMSLSECIVYTSIFSSSLLTLLSFILININQFSFINLTLILSFFSIILLIFFSFNFKKFSFYYDGNLFNSFFFFSFIGTLWRWFFRIKSFKWGDGITSHIGKVVIENLFFNSSNFSPPNVGFYSGMILDHSNIVAGGLSLKYYSLIAFNSFLPTFISTFILSFFVYQIVYLCRKDKNLALLASFIIASLGPIEIWFNTFSFLSGDLIYISIISLFILFSRKEKSFFYLVFSLVILISLSYYTAILVLILTSSIFLCIIFLNNLKNSLDKKMPLNLKKLFSDDSFKYFLVLLIFLLISLLFFSSRSLINHAIDTPSHSLINHAIDTSSSALTGSNIVTPQPFYPYQNKFKFLRISPLNWQNLMILFIIFQFILLTILNFKKNKKLSLENKNLLVISIPIFIISIILVLLNYEQRAFSYFLFFIFLIMKIPKKYSKQFFIFLILFFIVTGYFENIERTSFLKYNYGDVSGAKWVNGNLKGKVLSDERFISLLIEEGYHNVTGFSDDSPFANIFFHDDNLSNIKESFSFLDINYFVITRRMRKEYILMLSFPQEPMNNSLVYDSSFKKVYSNSEIDVYFIK